MTLNKKILSGFIICSMVMFVVAIISFRNSEKFIDTNQWVNHTHEVLYELDQISGSAVDAETGARGFVITGEENYLEPYNTSRATLAEHVNKATALTKDNPAQQRNIEGIQKLITAHLGHLETCIQLRKVKDFENAKALVATGEGKRILDEIRKGIGIAKEIEQVLLTERRKASDEDARNLNLILILLLSAIALVLIIVYNIISANLKALRRAETETANRNWTLSGSGELIKGMQGNKLPADLGQTIIDHLATYLNAQIGA